MARRSFRSWLTLKAATGQKVYAPDRFHIASREQGMGMKGNLSGRLGMKLFCREKGT